MRGLRETAKKLEAYRLRSVLLFTVKSQNVTTPLQYKVAMNNANIAAAFIWNLGGISKLESFSVACFRLTSVLSFSRVCKPSSTA